MATDGRRPTWIAMCPSHEGRMASRKFYQLGVSPSAFAPGMAARRTNHATGCKPGVSFAAIFVVLTTVAALAGVYANKLGRSGLGWFFFAWIVPFGVRPPPRLDGFAGLESKNPSRAGGEARGRGHRQRRGTNAATGLTYATRPAVPCCLPSDDRGSTRRLPPLRDRGTRSSR